MDSEDSTKGVKSDGWSTSYYEIPEGTKELQDLIEHKNMNFAVGNIFKAAYRLGDKEGTTREYDLNKIIFFAERELVRLQKDRERAFTFIANKTL
jgi:hypothetical protein